MVPKLRFKEFCGEWEEKRLGDVCKINPKNESLPDTFNYIDLENVVEGRLLKFNNTISKNNAPSRAKRLLQNNDILYQTVRPYQKNNFYFDIEETEIPYVASTGYSQLRTDKNNPKFIFQEIHTDIFVNNVLERCTGTSYPAINSSDLGNIRFTIPSLPEQTKIADFLSTVDDKIQNQEDKITHLENIKKGFMQKIFSRKIRFKDDGGEEFPEWEEKKIKDCCEYKNGESFENKLDENGQYNLISLNSIDSNGQLKKVFKKVSDASWYLRKDDLVMVLSDVGHGDFLGLSDLIPQDNKFVLNQRMGLLRKKNKINMVYIRKYINFNQKYFKRHGQGSSQQNLSKKAIENFKIEVPCLKEQQKIADFLSSFDEKISTEKETLEHLKQLKKGLLQQMFA